ncbi:MAG: FAD-dependent oxidoreductase [Clostridia bacterium]|nr:FAD-dependent oxidoreductase [Clostridia bacterium]
MKKYNLIVVGGGLTGVAAAVAAARQGLTVMLAERSGALGGAMNNCLVYPFMRYWTKMDDGSTKLLSAGLFSEMRARHDDYKEPTEDYVFYTEYFKFVLDEMIVESNIDVLFHSTLSSVKTAGEKITSASFATKAGIMEFEADFFIDATGDGDLFYMAGCDYQLGREADGLCQPMTTCFRIANVNYKKYYEQRDEIHEAYREKQKLGLISNPRENILEFRGLGEGLMHLNTTRVIKLNPTDPFDISRAEIKARKQIFEMFNFLKEYDAFKDSFIVSVAAEIGVRESRKLKGEHILTADELIACTKFEDAIALGNYDIDIHNPEGSGTSHRYFAQGEYYSIPYRSLLPKEFNNMLTAGRCLSATHEAQASVRIMPICATTGEAAGTAAAIAYNSGTNAKTVDVKLIQEALRNNGAAID